MEAEAIQFLAHGQAGNAEPPGGFGLIAVGKVDGLPEKLAFHVFDRPGVNAAFFAVLGIGEQFGNVTGQSFLSARQGLSGSRQDSSDVVRADYVAASQQQGLSHDVFQLANVAGPGLALQQLNGFGLNRGLRDAQFRAVTLDEIFDQDRDILWSQPQRGNSDNHNAEAVKEVLAKKFLFDGRLQIAMGGGDNADVDGNGLFAAQTLDAFFLKNAQQLGLSAQA